MMVEELGYFIPPSKLFAYVNDSQLPEAQQNPNLNVNLANIFTAIEASTGGKSSQEDFDGLFSDIDTNSAKLGRETEDKVASLRGLMRRIGV